MKNCSWEIQVWHGGRWQTDTWWATEQEAETERAFMASHHFVVRVVAPEMFS